MDQAVPRPQTTRILPPGILPLFAAAALPVASLVTPLGVYLPNYYASHLGLPLAAVGFAFALVRLLDILVDPAIGIAISATSTPFGRFRPWMAAGVPVMMGGAAALFLAEPGVSILYLIGWLLVLYAGFSMLTLGHSSWAAALAPEYHQRSKIYGWIYGIGVPGSVTMLTMPALFAKNAAAGIHAMGFFMLAITPITIGMCLFFVREPQRATGPEPITYRDIFAMIARPSLLRVLGSDLALALGPAITAALYLFFFEQFLGYTRAQTSLLLVTYIAAGTLGAPFWAQVAKRLGKHRTVMTGCVLYGFAQALVFVLPHAYLPTMVPGMFFAGFVVSCFAFLIRAMVADISDEVRLDIGKDRTALLYGLVTSTSKVGATISVPITFTILQAFGFVAKEGVANHGVPLDALVGCYVIVPVLTMFVGAFLLKGYKLDAARHDQIRAELAERDAALADEAIAASAAAPLLSPGE